ncbi:MAG: hypothetical protein HKN78_12885 [Sphingomonadaceae bacterium]|nr:hypothetical protein [Sphingomonadaceae bacterium]
MPWGRVGSNLLVAQFRDSFASRMTRIRNEPLNVIKDADEQLGWLRDFYGERNDDELLVASKHGLLSIADIDAFSGFLVEQGIRLIRHRRDNLVKVAVSQQRAELYARHSTEEDGKARWGVLRGEKPLGTVDLDPAEFVRTLRYVSEAQSKFDAFRPDCPTYDLEYETLKADPVAVGRDVMQWLGLDPQREIKLRFDKATPEKLRAAVPNLDTLRRASADAGFADLDAMFDE